jgi:hypothetical protein
MFRAPRAVSGVPLGTSKPMIDSISNGCARPVGLSMQRRLPSAVPHRFLLVHITRQWV